VYAIVQIIKNSKISGNKVRDILNCKYIWPSKYIPRFKSGTVI